ncbi:MAG: HAMP domain-containing histidine kinase [Maritimibacter sp.]|nr:HAMP domain-containing histidine kinase [Maritimibacter sp.]
MILRFFGFIWGAILLTLVMFAVLISLFDWKAPDAALHQLEQDIVRREIAEVVSGHGLDAGLETWARISGAHPEIAASPDPDCSSADPIRGPEGSCIAVVGTAGPPPVWVRIQAMLLPLAVGAVVSALGAIGLSRWLTRPIRTVNRGLQTIAGGELSTRIGEDLKTSNREFAALGRAFDHAAARLEELTESRQRLFHDISHEIRSPLARLRAAIGLMEVNPERTAPMLARMETDIERLDHLVDEILTLARFERGADGPETALLDLVDIVEPIVADANFEGQDRSVTVCYKGPERVAMRGNAELLHRAFENVIRNALAYSPDGGEVIVTGAPENGQSIFEVTDQGPGVPEAELDKLFDPFVKLGDGGRSQGIGLGLAIAARAVDAHGGKISAQAAPGQGLTVRIVLPVGKV